MRKFVIKRLVIVSLTTILVIGIGVALMYSKSIHRAIFVTTLFTGAEQYERFANIKNFYPVSTMKAAADTFEFPMGQTITLPGEFSYAGQEVDSLLFLDNTDTAALLVVHQGRICFEEYWLTGGRDVNWLSMSVAKSVISTAVGVAVDEGVIDILKPISFYVPELESSAYDGVLVKDVLQMSSGAAWSEDYSDPESDVMRMGAIMARGGSLDDFVAGMRREWEPGTRHRYNSADTQALGMLLTRATGKSISNYVEEKLWLPLGMEANGYWILDDYQMEMAFGGLNATARDYAKLGELYRLKGLWNGRRIISEQWVSEATRPDAPHVMPYANDGYALGYGYQWWIPDTHKGEYLAIGVYNQFIYVNPARDMVIVKLSANSDYALEDDEKYYREIETIEFFREIGRLFSSNTN